MSYKYLDHINSPEELKALDSEHIPELCSEIRSFLIDNIGKRGGHLASNLGVTELSVAIHRVFDSPRDHVIFDVGHQSYVHKILTGRRSEFSNLRKPGGLSGFTLMRESEHDAFGAGHSSTSVSAALGYAEADRLQGSDAYTVAVLGDGSYTGGMVHEALNNCDPDLKMIIILNENGMSISVNKGRFASYLSRVRISKGYRSVKHGTKSFLAHIPLIGAPLSRFLGYLKSKFKNLFLSSNYFEDLGLYYIGPIDGNNYKKVESALTEAKKLGKCVVLHLKTTKGKGYKPAEESPDGFHSVAKSDTQTETAAVEQTESFHSVFSDELIRLAENDEKIVAVTAAMGMGTGFDAFGKKYRERYFDVGIAEEHALTFSAGLAANGLKPFVGIYSTFLQRGYDSIVHDICLQNLPVRIIVDRASLSVGDGATHHGIFDVAFLSHIPSMRILAPITYESVREAASITLSSDLPIALRYPNAAENREVAERFKTLDGKYGVKADFSEENSPEYLFITYGSLVNNVIKAEKDLAERGYSVGTILLEELKPYRDIAIRTERYVKKAKTILFAEEGIANGGAAMLLGIAYSELGSGIERHYRTAAIRDNFASPTELCDLYDYVGLSPKALAEKMLGE